MISQTVSKKFSEYPIIAAVRTPEDFEAAFQSKVKVLFMVGGDVFKAEEELKRAAKAGYVVFLHMDLIEGIGRDASGLRFAKKEFGIQGIQSTKTHMLKIAKSEELCTVHRLFVTDFQSLKSGMTLVKNSNPDFVELTPGILPKVIWKVKREQARPIIASGLIATANEVKSLTAAGASNLVCSNHALWNL